MQHVDRLAGTDRAVSAYMRMAHSEYDYAVTDLLCDLLHYDQVYRNPQGISGPCDMDRVDRMLAEARDFFEAEHGIRLNGEFEPCDRPRRLSDNGNRYPPEYGVPADEPEGNPFLDAWATVDARMTTENTESPHPMNREVLSRLQQRAVDHIRRAHVDEPS